MRAKKLREDASNEELQGQLIEYNLELVDEGPFSILCPCRMALSSFGDQFGFGAWNELERNRSFDQRRNRARQSCCW